MDRNQKVHIEQSDRDFQRHKSEDYAREGHKQDKFGQKTAPTVRSRKGYFPEPIVELGNRPAAGRLTKS
jgi:hypothetical protein